MAVREKYTMPGATPTSKATTSRPTLPSKGRSGRHSSDTRTPASTAGARNADSAVPSSFSAAALA